jgi:hypothetical protein
MPQPSPISRAASYYSKAEIGAGALLLTLAMLLFAFQYVTLEKFASIPPGTGLATIQEWVAFASGRIALSWPDALLPLAMLGVSASLLSLELKGRTATA